LRLSHHPGTSFEFAAGIAVIFVLAVIFFLSGYYWRITLRWKIKD
jgi:hypothetical protein